MDKPDAERRNRWPRLVLVIPPEVDGALADLARAHYRDRRREALRLLVDGVEREMQAAREPR